MTRARARESEGPTSPDQTSTAPSEPECLPEEADLDVVILDVTNTSVRQSARSRRKPPKKDKPLSSTNGDDGQSSSSRRVTRGSMRAFEGDENNPPNLPVEVTSSPATGKKRTTRKKVSAAKKDVEVEPRTTRSTRSRTHLAKPKPLTPAKVTVSDNKSSDDEAVKNHHKRSSQTGCILDSDSEGEETYARPPPPKRSLLKLKKKKQPASSWQSGKKKGYNATKNDSDSDTKEKDSPDTAQMETTEAPDTDGGTAQSVGSQDTLYESCVSDMEPSTSPAGLQSRTFIVTPSSTQPVHTLSSHLAATPGYLSPNPQTPRDKQQPGTMSAGFLSPFSKTYVKPKRVESTTSVPYLSGTPRTIQRLQEEHRTRTKATLISLSELRR